MASRAATRSLDSDLYRLRKAQRRLSRKKKGSEDWKKQKRCVAKIHAEIKDRRNDFLHTLSRKIVEESQIIALESLNVKGMQRRDASAASVQNRSLSRSIADTGWSTHVQYISTKPNGLGAPWSRSTAGFPPRSAAPSVGTSGETKPLSARSWQWKECDESHDRDGNAAKNFRTAGLAAALTAEISAQANDSAGHRKTRGAFALSGHGPMKESFRVLAIMSVA
jgi:putative transposase